MVHCRIITLTRPLNKRPVFLGAISTSEFTAVALGPLLGGVITSQLSWRWCFFINIPLAGIPALVVALLLKLPRLPAQERMTTKDKLKELDFVGMTLFSASIFCLLLALQWGGAIYAWSNRRVIILLSLSPILFAGFFILSLQKQDSAMLPPRILRHKTMITGAVCAMCLAAANGVCTYYVCFLYSIF